MNITIRQLPCGCKDCSSYSACAEYSKYLIENGHKSNTPQNLSSSGRDSDIFRDGFPSAYFPEIPREESLLERLIRYFTKSDKKDTQREEHNDSVADRDKLDNERENKDKK